MLIEISEGFFVNPELVAVVKATGDDQCALFTAGQSAVDGGFTVDYEAAEVAEAVNDAEKDIYGENGEEEEADEAEEVEEEAEKE